MEGVSNMGVKEFSDAELIQAMRCCSSAKLGCGHCPADGVIWSEEFACSDAVVIEAADRLEKLSCRLDSAAGMILRLDDERRRAGG